ncbi:hypothetical protein ACTG9Q_24690 [Actinokineospora sp. 24-640]
MGDHQDDEQEGPRRWPRTTRARITARPGRSTPGWPTAWPHGASRVRPGRPRRAARLAGRRTRAPDTAPGRGRARVDRDRAARELAAAELVHIGEHLAATVTEAAPPLPGWYRVRAEDTPTAAGFAAYTRPPLVGGVPVRAVLWWPQRGGRAVALWGERVPEETGPVDQGAD